VFDVCAEYRFSRLLCQKVRYCGYVERGLPAKSRAAMRAELGISDEQRLVLVTAGGGEDGYHLMSTYVDAAEELSRKYRVRSLVVFGPELAQARANALREAAECQSGMRTLEFTDDMMSHMNAADVVVSMAGYNTICELLTLRKRAVVVPRVEPVQEQKIRAERMAELSAFAMIHPDQLNPRTLEGAIANQLRALDHSKHAPSVVDMDALSRITEILADAGVQAGCGTFVPELEPALAW
jgi:predicted glycosyltransferase